ncbi:hypothetical protein AVEN_106329-1 [Araneus ventricosus]|uniref:Uncharacterized protein n=1 Tax=Araneus ventricosus TaxID=182803 RepID=A0A4Y2AUL3_ARAVE|nr:hypothetical protein AVEN_106329-1 [Araneus ventricosus]
MGVLTLSYTARQSRAVKKFPHNSDEGRSEAVLLLLTHGSRPTREGVRPWQGLPGRRAAPAPRQHLFFIKKRNQGIVHRSAKAELAKIKALRKFILPCTDLFKMPRLALLEDFNPERGDRQ